MTKKEAIEQLNNLRDIASDETIDMAIEALHREIPKNPVINFASDSDGSRRLNDGWVDDALLCPVCHSYVGSVFDELYCGRCGQKIVQKRVRVIV